MKSRAMGRRGVFVSNDRNRSLLSRLALVALIFIGGSQIASHAQDGATPPASLFKHSRHFVGPSYLAKTPAAPRAGGLTFVPTFDSSITGDKNATAIMATLNAACAELASNFSDQVTV